MATAISVELLEVIGYADLRDPEMLPSIVPPMFRVRAEPTRVLVPPYTQNSGFLCGASEVHAAEVQEWYDAGKVALFDEPIAARTDFELWIDEFYVYHYETRIKARSKLGQFANQAIESAHVAFRKGGLDEAERFCSTAMSADDKRIEAFAIMAAIRRKNQDEDGERLMARLVSPFLNEVDFTRLVDGYFIPDQVNRSKVMCISEYKRIGPMHDVAKHRTGFR